MSSLRKVDSASTKSLRQKVLTKTASVKTAPTSTGAKRDLPTQTPPVNTAEITIKHAQENPEPLESDLEDLETSSVGSGTSSCGRRISLLYTTPKRGTGVHMDMVTGVANELLQKGKDALETAVNMKREAKAACHDSLQGLYETVLSLSDSRSRHICNLEKERSRHAQELVRVERAHLQDLANVRKTMVDELRAVRKEVTENLKETQAVRSWLGYETRDPFSQIEQIHERQERLDKVIEEAARHRSQDTRQAVSEKETQKWEAFKDTLSRINTTNDNLSSQLEGLRRELERTTSLLADFRPSNPNEPIPATPAFDPNLRELLEKVLSNTNLIIESSPQYTQTPDPTPKLDVITERLEIVSSEIRAMNSRPKTHSPPRPSLETELAVQEVKETLATIKKGVSDLGEKPTVGPNTYAQITAKSKPPQPNHTLIISSRDKTDTGDKVIDKIRIALDLKKTGVRVDRVRKARDQKVVLKCASKEDMAKIKNQVKENGDLSIREPANRNPLVCVRGVLSCFTDDEIVEHVKSQNKHLLQSTTEADLKMRVRYRKRARNPHECHPVLDLTPELWKRFIKAEKIYVGFGRCSVEDQSPLVQCAKCLGYGHTKALCRSTTDTCNHCGGEHAGKDCSLKHEPESLKCANCARARRDAAELKHSAYSTDCPERQKWDNIARSRIQYC